jgi:hypothetical protein
MTTTRMPALVTCLVASLALPSVADAQWSADPSVNNPLCTVTNHQYDPHIATDGAGGAIVAWHDHRDPLSGNLYPDIYAQRIDAAGAVQWAAGGVVVAAESNVQQQARLVSDGAGGAILVWEDYRNGSYWAIWAQRIDADGVLQWPGGVRVSTLATGSQRNPRLVPDGAGGAVITWVNYGNTSAGDIYAQRLDTLGTRMWSAAGTPICGAPHDQLNPRIAADGTGGAFIAWQDHRILPNGSFDIYVYRVNGSGASGWPLDGVPLSTGAADETFPVIAADDEGGAIVAWEDRRAGGGITDIYGQRVDASGSPQWQTGGVPICTATGSQVHPRIAPHPSGATIVWEDPRTSVANLDIYAQTLDLAGTALWTANGAPICTSVGPQGDPEIVPDGSGGYLISWVLNPDGSGDVYAQRLDPAGVPMWTPNGVAISTAGGSQVFAQIVPDGTGGAILTWDDLRGGPVTGHDVYAARVGAGGVVGPVAQPGRVPPTLTVGRSTSNPGDLVLAWDFSCSLEAEDYGIYEGQLGTWTSHVAIDCADDDGDRTEQISPASGNRYYLVVPFDAAEDGSYGTSTAGERPPAASACGVAHVGSTCQ